MAVATRSVERPETTRVSGGRDAVLAVAIDVDLMANGPDSGTVGDVDAPVLDCSDLDDLHRPAPVAHDVVVMPERTSGPSLFVTVEKHVEMAGVAKGHQRPVDGGEPDV